MTSRPTWPNTPGYLATSAFLFRSNRHFPRSYVLNWAQISGDWKLFKGKVKVQWGKLTGDELTTIIGKRDQLAGLLQVGTVTQRTRLRRHSMSSHKS